MNNVSRLVFALFAGTALAPLASGGNIVVPNDFPTIQQAVDAAGSGDSILVKAGSYAPFKVSGKPLSILGEGAGSVIVGGSGYYLDAPTVQIEGIPTGTQLVLSGMTLRALPFILFGSSWPTVEASGNSGILLFNDLRVEQNGDSASGVSLADSSLALLASCEVIPSTGSTGLHVTNSNVWVVGSDVRGGSGGSIFGVCFAPSGSSGFYLKDSTLYLADSTIWGGSGGFSSGLGCGPAGSQYGDGGYGILAVDSVLKLVSGTVQAGLGSYNPSVPGEPGLYLSGTSFCLLADATIVLGGDGLGGIAGPPTFVNPSAQLVKTTAVYPILDLSQPIVSPGESATFQVSGYPGSAVFLGGSLSAGPVWLIPSVDGATLLNPSNLAFLFPATLDATGNAALTLTAPSTPSIVGLSLAIQGLVLPPSDVAAFTNPVVLTTRF